MSRAFIKGVKEYLPEAAITGVIGPVFYAGKKAKRANKNDKNDKKEVGLTLTYNDFDDVENTLFIPANGIDAFRDLLKKKASAPERVIDAPTYSFF